MPQQGFVPLSRQWNGRYHNLYCQMRIRTKQDIHRRKCQSCLSCTGGCLHNAPMSLRTPGSKGIFASGKALPLRPFLLPPPVCLTLSSQNILCKTRFRIQKLVQIISRRTLLPDNFLKLSRFHYFPLVRKCRFPVQPQNLLPYK